MCSLCGALGQGPAWEQEGDLGASARWQRRREAMETARHLTAQLARRRVRVAAHPDHGFVVSYPTGGAEIAASLFEVWHRLARRGIAVPDPLVAP